MKQHMTWVEVDTKALSDNYHVLCSVIGAGKVAPVLKANAYGHGDELVCHTFAAVPRICVQSMSEALHISARGYHGLVLVMGCQLASVLQTRVPANLELTAGNFEFLRAWCNAKDKPKLHLKFDTGMGRQGFRPEDARRIAEEVAPHREHIVGVSGHFADAGDTFSAKYAHYQLERYTAICRILRAANLQFQQHHAASSAALLIPNSRFDFCRVGIALYGYWTTPTAKAMYANKNKAPLTLKPALSWRALIITVRQLPAGSYIGYGCKYCTTRETKIAVLPVGYYEGYPRQVSGSYAYVLVRGTRCPMLGIVSMNLIVVDVSHLDDVQVGETATLIGADGNERINAEQLAAWADTISYDIISRIHASVPRQAL